MTEIALATKLPISASNSCVTSSFGSQLNTSIVNNTPDCHNSEKSIVIGELETTNPNTTLASSFHSSSPPQRIPSVQQPNRPSGGYTTTCHQNVLPYSSQRTASPSNQLAHQHYHHHYNHYHSHQYYHHHYPFPIRQQAAVRHLQEFMLQQWHSFECRNHPVRSCGNPCMDTKSKPYYNTPRYSQSKRDFQSTAESKHVSLPHSLPQGDRNSPIHVSTKGPPGNQMISGPAMGETWTTAVPFYRRKLMSSSGNLSPNQQQSLRHSGSVDTMTWQRGYSTFQKNNNNARMPPADTVGSSGPRFTSPARGHSAGSSSGGSSSGSGDCTACSGCRPSQHGGSAGGGDDRTAVGAAEQEEEQVPGVSARKDRAVVAAEVVASRCGQPGAHPVPHTILSRPPPDFQQHRKHDDKCVKIACKTTEPSHPVVADENSLSGVERPSPVVSVDGNLVNDPLNSALTSSPAHTDSQRPAGETVFSSNTDKPIEETIKPKDVERSSSGKVAVASQSKWQSDLVSSGGSTGSDESRDEEAAPSQVVCLGQQVTVANVTHGCYAAASTSDQPAASLPTVAISVNTVSSSVSSGDGLTGGEHFWTPDPPASPANTVATSNEDSGSNQVFSLAQFPLYTSAVAIVTLDSLNDVD